MLQCVWSLLKALWTLHKAFTGRESTGDDGDDAVAVDTFGLRERADACAYDGARAWRELPGGGRKLSHVRHHFDLALRWFYPRVEKVSLDLRFDDEADDLVALCRWGSSSNRRGWGEMYCWLRPDVDRGRAEVMVWSRRIGWAGLSERVYDDLKALERESVFADGSVFMENPPSTATELLIFVPRVK